MQHFHPAKATDTQLLVRFEDHRDQRAFAELVRRHGPMVLATARRVLRAEEDVEDAFQATMLALAKAAGKLRRKAAVAGWLHKAAFRCAVDVHRSNARWKSKVDQMTSRVANEELEIEQSEPLLGAANEELERILDEELASLSESVRDVIVLCELEGLTQNQVAKNLGLPTSTVNDRLKRGRKLLHGRLVRRGATLTLSGIATSENLSSKATGALTEESITDISAKAALYAAGKPASELGVSATVGQIANKVAMAMINVKLIAVLLAAIVILSAAGTLSQVIGLPSDAVRGGTIFIDRFDDGDYADSTPAMWTPHLNSRLSIGGDGLIVSGSTFPAAQVEGLGLEDTSLRTEFKLQRGDSVTSYIRTREQPGRKGYVAAIAADGTVSISYDGTAEVIDQKPTNIDPMQDFVAMQIDAIGGELRLWVWRTHDPRPVTPLLEVTDNSGFVGNIGLGAASFSGTGAEAVFRLAHLADESIGPER